MKKKTSTPKLKLHRETVRVLDAEGLDDAVGGTVRPGQRLPSGGGGGGGGGRHRGGGSGGMNYMM